MPSKNLTVRRVAKTWKSQPTMEGAGVSLKRAFGFREMPGLDPFLLLDVFFSENPEDYRAGFPWHPHRGMETITYILDGEVEHGDSLGNAGLIRPGEVQWMTAGSGIVHQEMPKGDRKGKIAGFQLWANLPAKSKMMDPRYREVKRDDIPTVKTPDGATVRVIAGEVNGTKGPVTDVVASPQYLDVALPAGKKFIHPVATGDTVFAYVYEGEGTFEPKGEALGEGNVVLYGPGALVTIETDKKPVRFIFISGTPLKEPVAWYGPIVMNTKEELKTAFQEYQAGTFVKKGRDR